MESSVALLGIITVLWMKLDQTFHLYFGRFNGFLKDCLPCFVRSVCRKNGTIRSATCDSLSDTPTTSIPPSCQIFWLMMARAILFANARWACMGKLSSVPFFVVSMHMIHRRLPNIELLTHFIVRLENGLNYMPPNMVTLPFLLNECLTNFLTS